MDAYILSVCGAVIISSLVTILLPDGKTGKFINGVLKLFCLLVILVPLFVFFKNGSFDTAGSAAEGEISLDEEFIGGFYDEFANEEARAVEKKIEEELSVTVTAQIEWDFVDYAYEVSKVKIKIENFGMYGKDEHILVISKIEESVCALLNVRAEAVEIYE